MSVTKEDEEKLIANHIWWEQGQSLCMWTEVGINFINIIIVRTHEY